MSGRIVSVPDFQIEKNVSLTARETSLIIVDMQNDFVNPRGSLYVNGCESIIDPIRKLIGKAREKNVLIIYTMDTHRENDPEFEVWPKHAVEGTWGWRIIDELEPSDKDIAIRKIRYDAFFGTPLDYILRNHGIKYVIVCGVVANICVLHTAGSAALLGYRVVLPMDAIAALNKFDYYATIRQISFLYKGIITLSNEITFK